MPQDASGIDDVGDGEPPGLERRWSGWTNAVALGEMECGDLCPPGVQIVDQ